MAEPHVNVCDHQPHPPGRRSAPLTAIVFALSRDRARPARLCLPHDLRDTVTALVALAQPREQLGAQLARRSIAGLSLASLHGRHRNPSAADRHPIYPWNFDQ
jgi:hypothetical protein